MKDTLWTRSDRNRHGGGVVCYIRDSINYNLDPNFSNKFENIVLDLLFPDTKPILIGIFYNPPNKTGFIENLNMEIHGIETFNPTPPERFWKFQAWGGA